MPTHACCCPVAVVQHAVCVGESIPVPIWTHPQASESIHVQKWNSPSHSGEVHHTGASAGHQMTASGL